MNEKSLKLHRQLDTAFNNDSGISNMHDTRRKICILIVLHNVIVLQEGKRQKRKLMNESNDSLGSLLSHLVGVLLHQHHAMLLTVSDAAFSVDEYSTAVAKIAVGLSPDLPGT